VNDSDRPIQAFKILERSRDGGFCSAGGWDLLSGPGEAFRYPSRDRGIERGGSRDYGYLTRTSSGQECEPKIDALIFADGTYEGDEAVVRAMKAARDGLVSGLNYWSQEVRGKKPNDASLAVLLDRAESRLERDIEEEREHPLSPSGAEEREALLHQYWAGRHSVDSSLKSQLSRELADSVQVANNFQWVVRTIDAWRAKIDTGVTTKALNITNPPISDPAEPPDDRSEER
jgi:hypothetical protein